MWFETLPRISTRKEDMPKLMKVYAVHYIAKNQTFATARVVAENYDHAKEIGTEWGDMKFGPRVKEIKVEKSKGEIVADN